MDIQAQKEMIIEQFKLVEDVNLITAIKNLLDNASMVNKERFKIPEEDQKLVMERFEKIKSEPERLLDWDEAKKSLSE